MVDVVHVHVVRVLYSGHRLFVGLVGVVRQFQFARNLLRSVGGGGKEQYQDTALVNRIHDRSAEIVPYGNISGCHPAGKSFGFQMNVGATVVAFGTAMIITRRNGPLGGVGVMDLALPPTLWVCGAGWGPAVLGTFAYRFFTLWLPLPVALATLPRLRELISGRAS